jgi:hypothetical protein
MSVEWLGQFAADDVSPLQRAMVESARDDARAAAQAQRSQAEREAERERRTESMLFAERQLGNPLANMSAARSMYAEATDEVAEARTRLEKAERGGFPMRGPISSSGLSGRSRQRIWPPGRRLP